MTFIEYKSLDEVKGLVGSVIGTSPTMRIDQQRIDSFAELTLDNQWIHSDPIAASEGP